MRAGPVICLVGMPGSGKSTVGRVVADRLDAQFVDLDAAISVAAGRSIPEIFAHEGEAGFRDRERDALAVLVDRGAPVVVATGGGIVTTEEARALLGRTTCVWLTAESATLMERLADEASTRPLLADDPAGSILRLSTAREPLYRSVARHVVDTDGHGPEEIADAICRQVVEVAG